MQAGATRAEVIAQWSHTFREYACPTLFPFCIRRHNCCMKREERSSSGRGRHDAARSCGYDEKGTDVPRRVKLKPRVKKRCKRLAVTKRQVTETLRVPDARVLATDGGLHARRRLGCGRVLVVRYVETWNARKRCCRAVDVWCVEPGEMRPAGD